MTTPTKVPTTRTPVTLEQLVGPFVRAFVAATGQMPEPIDIAIVFGKKVAENGWPGPNETTWCFNIGNIRGVGPSGLYCVLKGAWELAKVSQVPELLRAGYVVMDPPPPQAKITPGMVCVLPPPEKQGFRAYRDLDEACVDYVATLRGVFRRTWAELFGVLTDPGELVDAMKADGYFSGDVSAYKRNVIAGVNWAIPKIAALLASMPRPDTIPEMPAVNAPIIEHEPMPRHQPLWEETEGQHTVRTEDPEL